MDFTTVLDEQFTRFEEDSAILKGLRGRANDLGYVTIGEALDAVPKQEIKGD